MMRVPGERASEIDPWRLARAMLEAEQADIFAGELPALADDTSLDTYNRLHVAQTYAGLLAREHISREGITENLAKLKLDQVARAWWEAEQKNRK